MRGYFIVSIINNHTDGAPVSTGTVDSHVNWLSELAYFFSSCIEIRTLTIHVGVEVQLSNPVCRCGFNPDTLPDTAAGRVEDVRRFQRLFANRNDMISTIRGIVDKYKPDS